MPVNRKSRRIRKGRRIRIFLLDPLVILKKSRIAISVFFSKLQGDLCTKHDLCRKHDSSSGATCRSSARRNGNARALTGPPVQASPHISQAGPLKAKHVKACHLLLLFYHKRGYHDGEEFSKIWDSEIAAPASLMRVDKDFLTKSIWLHWLCQLRPWLYLTIWPFSPASDRVRQFELFFGR